MLKRKRLPPKTDQHSVKVVGTRVVSAENDGNVGLFHGRYVSIAGLQLASSIVMPNGLSDLTPGCPVPSFTARNRRTESDSTSSLAEGKNMKLGVHPALDSAVQKRRRRLARRQKMHPEPRPRQ